MRYYSAATKFFYDDRLHKDIPKGAVPVTAKKYTEMMQAPQKGKIVVPDKNGNPVLSNREISQEVIMRDTVRTAKNLLLESDIKIIRHMETGEPISEELKLYRQRLRAVIRGESTEIPNPPAP